MINILNKIKKIFFLLFFFKNYNTISNELNELILNENIDNNNNIQQNNNVNLENNLINNNQENLVSIENFQQKKYIIVSNSLQKFLITYKCKQKSIKIIACIFIFMMLLKFVVKILFIDEYLNIIIHKIIKTETQYDEIFLKTNLKFFLDSLGFIILKKITIDENENNPRSIYIYTFLNFLFYFILIFTFFYITCFYESKIYEEDIDENIINNALDVIDKNFIIVNSIFFIFFFIVIYYIIDFLFLQTNNKIEYLLILKFFFIFASLYFTFELIIIYFNIISLLNNPKYIYKIIAYIEDQKQAEKETQENINLNDIDLNINNFENNQENIDSNESDNINNQNIGDNNQENINSNESNNINNQNVGDNNQENVDSNESDNINNQNIGDNNQENVDSNESDNINNQNINNNIQQNNLN